MCLKLNFLKKLFEKNRLTKQKIFSFLFISFVRLLAGISQFAVIILLTSKLSVESLGTYTIFYIIISYTTLLAGFNFHTYSIREIARHKRVSWPKLLAQHGRFLLANLVLVMCLSSFLFYFDILEVQYFGYFLSILAAATVNNQSENFLVGAGYPAYSSINLLLRTAWIIPLMLLVSISSVELNLGIVFLSWLISEIVTLIFMCTQFLRLRLVPKTYIPVDLDWILSGWRVGLRYTFLGLILIATLTVQRITLGQTHSNEDVGILQFYFAISVFLPNLIEASTYAIILPRLIQESSLNTEKRLTWPKLQLVIPLISLSIFGILSVYFFLPLVLGILGKQKLLEFRYLFLFTSLYALLYFLSRIFHYQLYASNEDSLLTRANLMSAFVAFLSSILLIPPLGIMGAAYSLIISGLAMTIFLSWPFWSRA